jgi:hypothetical protein
MERFDLRSFAPTERSEAWREVLAATHLPWATVPVNGRRHERSSMPTGERSKGEG